MLEIIQLLGKILGIYAGKTWITRAGIARPVRDATRLASRGASVVSIEHKHLAGVQARAAGRYSQQPKAQSSEPNQCRHARNTS
jgi:hypothetical protein